MQENISTDIIEKWLIGWSLSREVPLPSKFKSGFKINVGWEKQTVRYIFPYLNPEFLELTKSIDEPWIFLKVCTPADALRHLLPAGWKIQPQGYMMTCFHRMKEKTMNLDKEYRIELEEYNSTYRIKIIAKDGEHAGDGRVVLVDDLAIYDQISIDINHRRKGLATFLVKELEKIALAKGFVRNFLVATEEGRLLYSSLGWETYCLFTTVVLDYN